MAGALPIALFVLSVGSWIVALVTASRMHRTGWVVAIALLGPVAAFCWFLFGPWFERPISLRPSAARPAATASSAGPPRHD